MLYLTFRKVIAAADAQRAKKEAASPDPAGLRQRKGKGKEKAFEETLEKSEPTVGEDEPSPVVAVEEPPPEIDETLRALLT